MNTRFEEIYATNEWGHGSGEGSLPIHTAGYSSFLESFVVKRNVSSIVDMGCGDWQFSKNIRWGSAHYHGFDVVPQVIELNIKTYSQENVLFSLYSGDPAELPAADLLIVKDVLQHLSNQRIIDFLPNLNRFRFCLLTNCVNPKGRTDNRDITDGDFRYLDLRLPPFNVNATEVYSFTNAMSPLQRFVRAPRWRKIVLLLENTAKRGEQGNGVKS
jgi:hypothetical protein